MNEIITSDNRPDKDNSSSSYNSSGKGKNSSERNEKKSSAGSIFKTIATAALMAGGTIAAWKGAEALYDKIFSRWERPDYNLKPGVYCIERITNGLVRKEVNFDSDGISLRGYIYRHSNPKGLVVVCHGLHSGSDDYLPVINYFWENGYSIFSFNYKGTYESEGKSTVGMSESVVDLDHALTWISSLPEFSDLPVMLVGHSWGGFAVSSVLSLHPEVQASAVIAGFNSGYTLIWEKGEQYTGNPAAKLLESLLSLNPSIAPIAKLTLGSADISKPFLESYQKKLFKKYIECTAVKGVNNQNIPVLVAHGNRDMVISFSKQSLYAHKAELTNPNIIWYEGTGLQSGHDTIWHSERSIIYQDQVSQQIKQLERQKGSPLTEPEKVQFYNSVDHNLYSEINEELFKKILDMFDSVSKKI